MPAHLASPDSPAPSDAELATALQAGDAAALGVLWERYGDRVFTMCAHMLRDEHEAADVTSEVFLRVAERVSQLRDPAKLRPWLWAVARHEVYARSRRSAKVLVSSEAAELAADQSAPTDGAQDVGDPAQVAEVLGAALAGLDERDRLVHQLHTVAGLDGSELAQALGLRRDAGYQAVSRMRVRLADSVVVLAAVDQLRPQCTGLDGLLAGYVSLTPLWRKRVVRHLDRCGTCREPGQRLRRSSAAAAAAVVLAGSSTAVAAPESCRQRVLSDGPARLTAPSGAGQRWLRDGFPPRRARLLRAAVAAAVAVLVVAVVVAGTPTSSQDRPPAGAGLGRRAGTPASTAPAVTTTTTTTSATTGIPAPTTTAAPLPAPTTTARRSTTSTTMPGPTSSPTMPTPAPTTTTTTMAPTTTTADSSPPTVSISGPACVRWGSSGSFTVSTSDSSPVVSVTVTWSGSTSGSAPASGGPSSWSAIIPFASPMTSVTVRATARDAAGNTASAQTSTLSGSSCG